jgi:ribose transport system substrate-binding protein
MVWAHVPDFYPYIKDLSNAGINAVVPHFPINQGDAPGLKANLGADPVAYSKAAAEAIGQKINGKGTVAVTEGSFNTVEDSAAKSFAATMNQEFPNVKVLAPQEEGFEVPTAVAKAVSIINNNSDIVGAFSTTGGGATTWATAQDQSKKQLVIIGVDYTRQNLELIKAGKVYAVVAQPLYDEAVQSVILLDKLLKGETVPYKTVLPSPLVTADKVDTYLDIVNRAEQAS